MSNCVSYDRYRQIAESREAIGQWSDAARHWSRAADCARAIAEFTLETGSYREHHIWRDRLLEALERASEARRARDQA